ncbi:MAG TPA: S8 family peptidase [Bdellovibrionales bacterium]|nr:S8 family peptidase [Bdellovibrionales bacterium]
MKLGLVALVISIAAFNQAQAATAPFKGYLIKLRKPVSARSLNALSSLGVRVKNTIPEINLVVADTTPELNKKLAAQSALVEYVEPNYVVRAFAKKPDIYEQSAGGLWGMKQSGAIDAWRNLTTGSPDVVIAISDTGIWADHFDLQANIYRNPGETGVDANGKDKSKNKIDDDNNGFVDDYSGWNFETNNNHAGDDHYHGTHVAGTVGGRGGDKQGIAGVAWNVKLMPLKFLGMDGSGTTEGGIATIIYAAKMGARAVNCSWGGDGYTQAMYDAIEYAKSKNTIVVAAAGNDSTNIDKKPDYPAAYDNENLITVAATFSGNKELAGFSNYGEKLVHLAAPGHNIYSSFNPMYRTLYCDKWFCHLSGTSMAAPHVSGAIGLMYSVNPNLTYKQVKEILLATAVKQPKLAQKVAAGGTLQVCDAVKAAKDLAKQPH